jgi:hypothetical protein
LLDAQYFIDAGFSPEQAAALAAAFQQLERAARQYAKLRSTTSIHWNPECQCYRNEQQR